MRAALVIIVLSVSGASACGLISGLSGYGDFDGAMDGSVSRLVTDTGVPGKLHDSSSASHDGSVPVVVDASGDVGPSTDGTVSTEDDAEPDASAASDGQDAGGEGLPDGTPPDGPPPPCSPETCSNCCSNNVCVGGQSVATCGTGGAACTDCTNMGGACGSNGACTTAVKDAAPPPACVASSCRGCDGFYQKGCCKSDDTCGCLLVWVPGSPCQ